MSVWYRSYHIAFRGFEGVNTNDTNSTNFGFRCPTRLTLNIKH
nr:MAG TPA: hypothetical protein [Caudoviricetes sp.]